MYTLYSELKKSKNEIVKLQEKIAKVLYARNKLRQGPNYSSQTQKKQSIKVDEDFIALVNEVASRGSHESNRSFYGELEVVLTTDVKYILNYDYTKFLVENKDVKEAKRYYSRLSRSLQGLVLFFNGKDGNASTVNEFFNYFFRISAALSSEATVVDKLLDRFSASYRVEDRINIIFRRHSLFEGQFPTVSELQKSLNTKKRILNGFSRLVGSNEPHLVVVTEKGSWLEVLSSPPAVAISIASLLSGIMHAVKTGMEIYKLHLETKKLKIETLNEYAAGLLATSKEHPIIMTEKLTTEAFKLNPYEGPDKNEVENHVKQSIKDLISFVSNKGELRFETENSKNKKILEEKYIDDEQYLDLIELSSKVDELDQDNEYYKLLEEN